jgi:hypothetical protein
MARSPGDVRNDRNNAVTKFCLAMEEHRRTEAGRVRTAKEMVDFFFPRHVGAGKNESEDRIFLHIPPEVRGPIVSGWGVRGAKSAIRDTDEKVRQVVFDALAAGDIDETIFEEGVNAQTLIDWVPLTEWWAFWRSGKLTGVAVQKALAVARDLALFDDRWYLQNVDGRGGKLKGTDTLCDTLSKDQIIAWIRKVHESGDGSPAGLIAALGWETVLAKTSQEALLFSLDAFAKKVGLVVVAPATEMPAPTGDENAVVPDMPATLDPPTIGEGSDWQSAPPTPVASETREEGGSANWPAAAPAQSGTMLSADESPISFREVPAESKPKAPPPVPSSQRKAR